MKSFWSKMPLKLVYKTRSRDATATGNSKKMDDSWARQMFEEIKMQNLVTSQSAWRIDSPPSLISLTGLEMSLSFFQGRILQHSLNYTANLRSVLEWHQSPGRDWKIRTIQMIISVWEAACLSQKWTKLLYYLLHFIIGFLTTHIIALSKKHRILMYMIVVSVKINDDDHVLRSLSFLHYKY